jgi:hypothetical protein
MAIFQISEKNSRKGVTLEGLGDEKPDRGAYLNVLSYVR